MTESILYAREGALAHLTFNRPASLNAMGFEMGRAGATSRARSPPTPRSAPC